MGGACGEGGAGLPGREEPLSITRGPGGKGSGLPGLGRGPLSLTRRGRDFLFVFSCRSGAWVTSWFSPPGGGRGRKCWLRAGLPFHPGPAPQSVTHSVMSLTRTLGWAGPEVLG